MSRSSAGAAHSVGQSTAQDGLQAFRDIAAKCTEEECLEIIEDCQQSRDPVVRTTVCGFYEDRLFKLQERRREVEHYEAIYEKD